MRFSMDYGKEVSNLKYLKRQSVNGLDLKVETKTGHTIQFNAREHGFRLWVDDKEQMNLDFQIK